MFRKTISRLGQENPKKKVEPIAPTRKLYPVIYAIANPVVRDLLNRKISEEHLQSSNTLSPQAILGVQYIRAARDDLTHTNGMGNNCCRFDFEAC